MPSLSKPAKDNSALVGWVFGCLIASVTAAAQTASAASDPPMNLDGKAASRLVLTFLKPEYPAVAKMNYIQGRVQLQVLVRRDGRVGEAHVIAGHPFLAASALKAIRRWVYRPLVTGSGPVEFLTHIKMNFSLSMRKTRVMPRHAVRDLDRQIRPPEIVRGVAQRAPLSSVRLRVLVGDDGHVIDSQLLGGAPSLYAQAQKNVEAWIFRPARWGSVPVPWYLDVEVPVEEPTARQGAGDLGGQ